MLGIKRITEFGTAEIDLEQEAYRIEGVLDIGSGNAVVLVIITEATLVVKIATDRTVVDLANLHLEGDDGEAPRKGNFIFSLLTM